MEAPAFDLRLVFVAPSAIQSLSIVVALIVLMSSGRDGLKDSIHEMAVKLVLGVRRGRTKV